MWHFPHQGVTKSEKYKDCKVTHHNFEHLLSINAILPRSPTKHSSVYSEHSVRCWNDITAMQTTTALSQEFLM